MQLYYYPRVSRRILIALLDMFNKMKVYNYTTSGTVANIIDVPLKFGPSEKYHLFNTQTESGKKYYPKIPSMLMSIDNISYNSDRATSVNEIRTIYNDALDISQVDSFWCDVQPTPYDYSYTLDIKTESIDHLFQVFENILPYFNPTNHLRIKEFDFLNMERDLRVKLESTSIEYPSEMTEEESRYFNGKINLTVHGYMYRPIDYAKVIKYIKKSYIHSYEGNALYTTSGIATSATPPNDYNFSTIIDESNIAYTKVTEITNPYHI